MLKISPHAISRFQERFDSAVNYQEAKQLLRLAYEESVPCPKRLRPSMKARRGVRLRYHKLAGLVLLVKPPEPGRTHFVLVTCWVVSPSSIRSSA